MKTSLTRRTFLGTLPILGLATLPADAQPASTTAPTTPAPNDDWYPTQPRELIREMVGVSHGNVPRVRALLEERPTLARAAWDWGYGDWESALGAASHVGHREIAELLLAHGARPSIFSAAMLGQLEVVRAFVTASPGIQRTKGPHGITLLAHAKAGGTAAAEVVKYLETVGDADTRPTLVPLAEDEPTKLTGSYVFGPGSKDRFEVTFERSQLSLKRTDATPRPIHHLGALAFYPAGCEAVRVRFSLGEAGTAKLTIHDPGLVVEATRAST